MQKLVLQQLKKIFGRGENRKATTCFQLKWACILFLITLVFSYKSDANAQSVTYIRQGKTYVRLVNKQPKNVVGDSEYNPNVLIPHWNPKTKLWGYIRRNSRELVVPHRFFCAGTFGDGYAIAMELSADSLLQHLFSVGEDGQVNCILHDESRQVTSKSLSFFFMNIRQDDGFVTVKRGNCLSIINPQGFVAWDSCFDAPDLFFHYLGHGHLLIPRDSMSMIFTPNGEVAFTFNHLELGIHAIWLGGYGETDGISLFPVVRKSDSKVAFWNQMGKRMTDFKWDTVPNPPDIPHKFIRIIAEKEAIYYYQILHDSTFYAWQNGKTILTDLSGKIIYTYKENEMPMPNKWPVWVEQGMYPKTYHDENGKVVEYAYFNPITGVEVRENSPIYVINPKLALTQREHEDPYKRYFYRVKVGFDLNEGLSVEPRINPGWEIIRTERIQGRYYHVDRNIYTNDVGLSDDHLKTIIPSEYQSIVIHGGPNAAFPEVEARRKESKRLGRSRSYDLSGRLLFEDAIHYFIPSEDTLPTNNSLRNYYTNPIWDRELSCRYGLDIPYANRLSYVEDYYHKGKRYRAVKDIYGRRYF